jgi:hypothetical protein
MVMVGVDVAVGYLAGWIWRKARRVAGRADADLDQVLDVSVERLHRAVATKLGGDAALEQFEQEASADSDAPSVPARTRQQLQLALEEALDRDPEFAAEFERLVSQAKAAGRHAAGVRWRGGGGSRRRCLHQCASRGRRRHNPGAGGGLQPSAAGPGGALIGPGDTIPFDLRDHADDAAPIVFAPYGVAIGTLVYQRARREGRVIRLGSRPSHLVGREALLAEIHRGFASNPESPQMRVLHGLGGVGKTSIALEYAHRHARDYELIWQFNAEDAGSLAGQVSELAALLGLMNPFEHGDALSLLHGELAGRARPWLLLIDNVTDPALAFRLTPAAGPGHILVTSQAADWPRATAVEVAVLDRDVATAFLLDHTADEDRPAADELADALGLLPLALAQAAAFLRNTGRPLRDYLHLLSSDCARLLARTVPGEYGKAVTGAWDAAITYLSRSAPDAVDLLRLLACYAPDAIPIRRLLRVDPATLHAIDPHQAEQIRVLAHDGFALDDALTALRGFSLISAPANGTVSLHRLVQAVTLDALVPAERGGWRQSAATLLRAALPGEPELPASWPQYAALAAHCFAVFEPWSDGLFDVARFLHASGNYREALNATGQVAAARERELGRQHPDTLSARAWLAWAVGTAGDAAHARDLFAGLLAVSEHVHGSEHPETLATRHSLAAWTGQAGDPTTARDMFAALLPIRERVEGSEHPNTLITRHSLAYWTGELGDATEAREQQATLLRLRERIEGPEHPRTLNTRHNLAAWTGEAGDPTTARDMFAALLPIRERIQGPEHASTLAARHSLARWTGEAGDPTTARDMFAALLPIRERIQGPEHPDTVATRHALELWTERAE